MPDKIMEILKTSLKIESDGVNFYTMASESSSNDSARKIFSFLAEEEKKHYQFFLDHFRSIEKNVPYDFANEISRLASHSKGTEKLFTKDFIERLKGDNHSLSAVSIGIALEKNSIDFYKSRLKEASGEDEKKYYRFLVESEVHHHDFLSGIEREIIEESWSENRFSPF